MVRSNTEVLTRAYDHIRVKSMGKIYILRFHDCIRTKEEIENEYNS